LDPRVVAPSPITLPGTTKNGQKTYLASYLPNGKWGASDAQPIIGIILAVKGAQD